MTSREIIAELPKLTRPELEEVDAHLRVLMGNRQPPTRSWGTALMELAGTAQGLLDDFAHNHDHYLHLS